jgi:hypothetical protein
LPLLRFIYIRPVIAGQTQAPLTFGKFKIFQKLSREQTRGSTRAALEVQVLESNYHASFIKIHVSGITVLFNET